jgi:hypothetical protein
MIGHSSLVLVNLLSILMRGILSFMYRKGDHLRIPMDISQRPILLCKSRGRQDSIQLTWDSDPYNNSSWTRYPGIPSVLLLRSQTSALTDVQNTRT